MVNKSQHMTFQLLLKSIKYPERLKINFKYQMIKSNKIEDGIFIKVNREIKIFGKKTPKMKIDQF